MIIFLQWQNDGHGDEITFFHSMRRTPFNIYWSCEAVSRLLRPFFDADLMGKPRLSPTIVWDQKPGL
jgi:hypothetical protein